MKRYLISMTSVLLCVILLIELLPLSVCAAEKSDWKRVVSTPRITFLNEMGVPLAEELTDLYVGEDGLCFDESKVSYGEIKELDYASVQLNFRYVDYNYYVDEDQIDESGVIQGLQAIARLEFGDESMEESYIGFSRDAKSGYLIADIEFKEVNPFVDENDEVSLFIQYVSSYGEKTVTYKAELEYVFSQRIQPPPPEEIEKEDEKLEVEIIFPEPPQKEEEEPSIRTETPYILVEKCRINDDVQSVVAGSGFTLNLQLRNTHKRMSLDNVRMQVDMPAGLRLEHAGNSFYLGDMEEAGVLETSLSFYAVATAEMEDYHIILTFDYEYVDDDTRRFETAKVEVTVPLRQPLELIVDPIQVPSTVECGTEQNFYSPYANHSHSTMYHVTVNLETELFAKEKVFHLGNLEAGEGGSLKFTLLTAAAGTVPVQVTYTYENELGQVFSKNTSFELSCVEPEEEEGIEENKEPYVTTLPQETTKDAEQKPYVVLLGLTACAFLAVLLVLYGNMKKEQ